MKNGSNPCCASFSLSAVFPCYNDRETIGGLVRETGRILSPLCREFEIIVVDDGSTDGSPELLRLLRDEIPELRILVHDRNRGYGVTIRDGLEAARFPYVFYTDGDGQYSPADLPRLVSLMDEGVEMVTGYRRIRNDPFPRVLGSRVFYGLVQWFVGISFRDVSCDYRLMRKETLAPLRLQAEGGELGLEILVKSHSLGFRIVECPISHYARRHGSSFYFRPSVLIRTLKGVGRVVRWRKEENL